jgi:hypothetical protein
MRRVAIAFLGLLTLAACGRFLFSAQASLSQDVPEPTAKRLQGKDWWPTRTDSTRKDYAGTEACAGCHREEVLEQQRTAMAQAASRASQTEILRANPKLARAESPFLTEIQRDRTGSVYVVSQGGAAMSGRLEWSMGQGSMGQTFIVESGGTLYESQLSYFAAISGLDLTPGHTLAGPRDLERAFGEPQSPELAQRCFGCHTTASSEKHQFDPSHAIPGITCEACHGPGGRHVKAMRENPAGDAGGSILNPGAFSPVKLIDYCGACHRAPLDVATARDRVPIDVRFQPYRLSKSRCWSQPDPRITCIACHNPHLPLEQDGVAYDSKCLACHAPAAPAALKTADAAEPAGGAPVARTRKICPKASSHCVSCHMPKYKVPQLHGSFTDHNIRIVRPGDPYPL